MIILHAPFSAYPHVSPTCQNLRGEVVAIMNYVYQNT